MKRVWMALMLGVMFCGWAGAQVSTYYVDASRPDNSGTGLSWAEAKQTIQAAVDLTVGGDTIWVADGMYNLGGAVTPGGSLFNRVCVTNNISIISVNGPAFTAIVGGKGGAAARCVYMSAGTLDGFTLTNGTTQAAGAWVDRDFSGGGVFGGRLTVVTNCVLVGNRATAYGGGAFGGQLFDCEVRGNYADTGGGVCSNNLTGCDIVRNTADAGAGAAKSILAHCTLSENRAASYGGGAFQSYLEYCSISNNYVSGDGGGALDCSLDSCSLVGNRSDVYGGGSYDCDLTNCTLRANVSENGGASYSGNLYNCRLLENSAEDGGGSYHGVLNRCILADNTATDEGGGCNGGHLISCLIVGNTAGDAGGGSYNSSLSNCTVVDNAATNNGGGVWTYSVTAELENSIIWGNASGGTGNDIYNNNGYGGPSVPRFCCASDGVTHWINGCITTDPLFVDAANDDYRLQTNSPCINMGFDAYASGTNDLDGNARIINGHVDMGAYESAVPYVKPAGTTYYVDASRADDSGDGLSWTTAKKTIQAAVDLAIFAGDSVLVTNGLYELGGKAYPDGVSIITNRVCAYGPISVKSVNGPDVTIIKGAVGSNGSNDVDSIRGAYLNNGAELSGFTVTNGYTIETWSSFDGSGGGLFVGTNSVATNCIITGCLANNMGGGAYMYEGGHLANCIVVGNRARGDAGGIGFGSASDSIIKNNYAYQGGGAEACDMERCIVAGNTAVNFAGGVVGGDINNCLIVSNNAEYGGGAGYATLNNCTLSANVAVSYGGGAHNCHMTNSIAWGNTAGTAGRDVFVGNGDCVSVCASDGVVDGVNGCMVANPLFMNAAGGNFRLTAMSPCRDAGTNTADLATLDLDKNERLVSGKVDMGAYEFNGVPKVVNDFDGEWQSDAAIFRPYRQLWVVHRSGDDTMLKKKWGVRGDIPVPADYDGDGKVDIAVFRPSTGWWYILKSSDGSMLKKKWGVRGDVAVPADYDGDNIADFAVFRPSTQRWIMLRSSDGVVVKRKWGVRGDIPVPADYDGDGVADIAVFRPTTGWWYGLQSNNGVLRKKWGVAGDVPVPGDYDADTSADLAIYRPSTQQWVALSSNDGSVLKKKWGIAGDIPVPGDYDGDGKTDVVVFRPSTGWWYANLSQGGIQRKKWGVPGDEPVSVQYWINKTIHK